jgi:predicted lipid-binding transport protein (Tim44 family)
VARNPHYFNLLNRPSTTSQAPSASPTLRSAKKTGSTGSIVGGIAGGVTGFLVLILAFIALLIRRRRLILPQSPLAEITPFEVAERSIQTFELPSHPESSEKTGGSSKASREVPEAQLQEEFVGTGNTEQVSWGVVARELNGDLQTRERRPPPTNVEVLARFLGLVLNETPPSYASDNGHGL